MTRLLLLLLAVPVLADANKPDLSLWGYQGWHPVNDYNTMTVADFNSINPYHTAMVYLPESVTANCIKTNYTREGSLITIDGASVKEIYLNGAVRLDIKAGYIDYIDAEDYAEVYYYNGDVNSMTIREMAQLEIAGDWNCDHKVNFIDLAVFAKVFTEFEDLKFICRNWLKGW